jgi:signal transduction histidine kinase
MAKHFRLYLLLTVLAVFVFTSSVAIWAFYQAVKTENHVRYVGMMNIASEKIAKTIRGMEMNADELIYKPFTKIDLLSEGLGLGLPLSKRHALRLGGDLVYDKSYQDGCRFILEIPK